MIIVDFSSWVGFHISCHLLKNGRHGDQEAQSRLQVFVRDGDNAGILRCNHSVENLSLLRVKTRTVDHTDKNQGIYTYPPIFKVATIAV